MSCDLPYPEMMSLKLDGLLDDIDERLLQVHLRECTECAALWAAMQSADDILCAAAAVPVTVPMDFQARIMLKVAASPVYRPVYQDVMGKVGERVAVAGVGMSPAFGRGVGLPAYAPLSDYPSALSNPDVFQEWQQRLSHYMKGAVAVMLSIVGTAGLLIGLLMSNTIQVSGPAASWIDTLRTFFSALSTWVGSIFGGVGGGVVAGMALVMGLMLLVGWQVVTGYHRSLASEHSNGGMVEALG